MRTRRAVRALAAGLACLGMAVASAVVAPAAANADVCPAYAATDVRPAHDPFGWFSQTGDDPSDGDAGGVSVWAKLTQNCFRENYYRAEFRSYGEVLVITDSYGDGLVPKVYLDVENNGRAVYYGSEDDNLSFDEGLEVWIRLCIEDTGICTPRTPVGTT